MSYKLAIINLLFMCSIAHASDFHKLSFEYNLDSTQITQESKTDASKVKIQSLENKNFKLNYLYNFTRSILLSLNFGFKEYNIEDRESVINNNKKFRNDIFEYGIKYIFANWGAISLLRIKDFDISQKIQNNNNIIILYDAIEFNRFIYHQYLFDLYSIMFSADLGLELETNNNYLTSRTGHYIRGNFIKRFTSWGIGGHLKRAFIMKSSEDSKYSQTDTIAGLEVDFYF